MELVDVSESHIAETCAPLYVLLASVTSTLLCYAL